MRTQIAERLVRALAVVPVDPAGDSGTRVGKVAEVVLPNAFLFEAAKEALDDPVLLRSIGRDELLAQAVVAAGGAKAPALEDQPIVAANHRGSAVRTQGTEAADTGLLERALGLLGAPPQRKLVTRNFTIMTINHGGEMAPAVGAAIDMGQVHGPALVALLSATGSSVHSRPRRHRALMYEPAFEPQHAVHRFAIDPHSLAKAQHHPQPSIAEGWVRGDEPCDTRGQKFVEPRHRPRFHRPRPQSATRENQHSTHSAHRNAGQRRDHSCDVPGIEGRSFIASLRMSRSMVSSPTLRCRRLSSSSRRLSSSFTLARSAFSAPSRKRSRHCSVSATVSPCLRAASASVVSPLSTLRTSAALRFAVQRCTSSNRPTSTIATSIQVQL